MLYSTKKNRVVERMNKTLLEKFKCMLSDLVFNKSLWIEAVSTCYLMNLSLSTAIDFKNLIEVWSNKLVEH